MPHKDLTETQWQVMLQILLEPTPGKRKRGQRGRARAVNRKIINGILWKLRTGASWRNVPEKYGKWGTIYRCFHRWQGSRAWEKAIAAVAGKRRTR